jgi:hypothetical protein
MWLIEWKKGKFVDAERIQNLSIDSNGVSFFVAGEPDNEFKVENVDHFLNSLQVINENRVVNIEKYFQDNQQ